MSFIRGSTIILYSDICLDCFFICTNFDFALYLDYRRFLVRVSYLELYNEEVRDLLSKNVRNRLEIRERADIGVYVKDLSKFSVKNPEDMDRLMAIGNKNSMSI